MKASSLFTLEKSCAGVALEIRLPNGQPSGQSITVRGTDSPEFQSAAREKNKQKIDILALPLEKQESAFEKATLKLMASVVAGWTFEEKLTPEAVEALFKNAPDVLEQVDNFCTKRANFFKLPSKNC